MWRNKNCHVNILDTISAKFCISRILFCLHAELFYISEHYSENFWTHTLLNFLLSRLTNFRLAILTLLLHILVKTNLFLHAQCYRIHRIKKFGKNTSFLTLKVGSAPNLESFSKTKIMHRILKKKDLIPQTWIIWMPKVGCSKKNFWTLLQKSSAIGTGFDKKFSFRVSAYDTILTGWQVICSEKWMSMSWQWYKFQFFLRYSILMLISLISHLWIILCFWLTPQWWIITFCNTNTL